MMRYIVGLLLLAFSITACQEKQSQSDIIDHMEQMTAVMSDEHRLALSNQEVDKVFYLVRHAEKDTIPKDNPRLTAQGEDRAHAIADIFRQTRIDEIYSTMYTRTLWTAETLSEAKGINIKPYNPSELKAFAEQLKQNEKIQAALIVGHSNTTPQLASFLAGDTAAEIQKMEESEYDRLIMVMIHTDGSSDVKQLRYFTETL